MAGEIVVLVTTKNLSEARRISDRLVKKSLAACVNIVPRVESIYTWKGRVCKDKEGLMIIKTRAALFSRLEKQVKSLHGYTVPEIIALPIKLGSKEYLSWIRKTSS